MKMIFNDRLLDNIIDKHKIIQLSYITEYGSQHYNEIIMKNGYYDITKYFIDNDLENLDIESISNIIQEENILFRINEFYDYWILRKHKIYKDLTWQYYKIFQEITNKANNKFIISSYKRVLINAVKSRIEIIDSTLFCDFLDLYIYPYYHEYKLYTQDIKAFNELISQATDRGEFPAQYNMSMVQYMKSTTNSIEKIYY